jgi:hypothetical protein
MQTLRGEASGQRPRIMVHHASLRQRQLSVRHADYGDEGFEEHESERNKGCAMKVVYLLWSSDSEVQHLEEIFAYKIDAEKAMRLYKEQDDGRGYHYWIQEREVHLGGTK